MKNDRYSSVLAVLATTVLACTAALAAPPAAINIHGQLIGESGVPVTGSRTYVVQFYDSDAGDNAIGSPLAGTVDVSSEGLFNLDVTPPDGILTAAEVWYAIGVDTDTPADNDASDDVFPNLIRVYSVPFALQAEEVVAVDADRVGDGTVDNAELDALDGVTSNVQGQIDAIDTSGIATNAAAIDQNTLNIATNANNISLKADAADVYTRASIDAQQMVQDVLIANKADSADTYLPSEADAKFVDATGDTMSGALGVDTVTEATADAGVTIDGILLLDGVLALPQTAPADTTEKLYNFGSELFWGDAQITNVATNKDNLTNDGTLAFDWVDDEIADDLTIQGGTVDNDSFSALGDLNAESAIGTGAAQVAAGDHDHDLSGLSGAVNDAQVADALTIQGGSIDNDSFSAFSDLNSEAAIGSGLGQVALGIHGHNLQDLGGAVTDAQVPDNITITETDTLESVTSRGASVTSTMLFSGAAQSLIFTQPFGNYGISSLSSLGLTIEDIIINNGSMANVGQVIHNDDAASNPALTYGSDTDTGIHRPGANQLAMVTGGASRLTVDNAEVNITGNTLEMAAGAAPGVTTNKLYNTAGNLFWNGTQLDAGGGGGTDTDSLSWSIREADAIYSGYTYFAQEMTRSGTIASFQVWCSDTAANFTADLQLNGISVLSGPVGFVADSLQKGVIVNASFVAGDVLSYYLGDGTGYMFAPSLVTVVNYD